MIGALFCIWLAVLLVTCEDPPVAGPPAPPPRSITPQQVGTEARDLRAHAVKFWMDSFREGLRRR